MERRNLTFVRISFIALLPLLARCSYCKSNSGIVLKTATSHPIRYYLSLPPGWTNERSIQWPVVVAIESADRDFKANAEAFVQARGDMPFILVVPEVVTNGGPRYREAPGYSYDSSAWARVTKDGEWKFDEAGIDAIIEDVSRLYHGDKKFFITGWEAGTHTVFAMAFNHPEKLGGVAPVCPNYAGRHVSFTMSAAAGELPVCVFSGTKDPAWAPGLPLFEQTKRADAEARAHGFRFHYRSVAGGTHGPLAHDVLVWFESIRKR